MIQNTTRTSQRIAIWRVEICCTTKKMNVPRRRLLSVRQFVSTMPQFVDNFVFVGGKWNAKLFALRKADP